MPNPTIYTTGTVSVTAGATAVTGVGTVWSGLVKPGSHITIGGSMGIVASVSSDTALTLASVWAGSNQSGQPYAIAIPPGDSAELAMKGRALIEAVTARGIAPINAVLLKGGPTNTPPGSPTTGDRYIVGTSPTGAWSGQAGKYAEWSGSAWTFTSPTAPAYSVVTAGGGVYVWDGLAWSATATANSADATLLARANHTGTQLSTTISDFAEAVDDRVAVLLVAGGGIVLTYNDGAGTLTIAEDRLKARITADVGPIAATETQVVGFSVTANGLAAGAVFRIKAAGKHTNTTTGTTGDYKIKFGGVVIARGTFAYGATARTDTAFDIDATVTIRTIGATGTAIGSLMINQSLATPIGNMITAPATIDTTATATLELTYASGGASTNETFTVATIEQLG